LKKDLLCQVKNGPNKPNKLYLGSLKVNSNDVYILKENNAQILDIKRILKNQSNIYIKINKIHY